MGHPDIVWIEFTFLPTSDKGIDECVLGVCSPF